MSGGNATGAVAFYSAAETAKMIGIDESTLYRHLRNGSFPALKIGGRYIVPHAVLERLISDVLATGQCVDVADWTERWRAEHLSTTDSLDPPYRSHGRLRPAQ